MKPARPAALLLLLATTAHAQTAATTIRNHQFDPPTITVPAGQKVELHITNADPTEEEFDSEDLRREKLVAPGQEATVYIGPLKPGSYAFEGEFHPKTAQGHVEAR